MFEKSKGFIQEFGKDHKQVSGQFEKLSKNKCELIWIVLKDLTKNMNALFDRNDGLSFRKALRTLLHEPEKYVYPSQRTVSEKSVVCLADDEELLIEVFKQLLSDNYESPSKDLILLQKHLEALWLYYCFIERDINIPVISHLMDFAAMEILFTTALAILKIDEKGLRQDHGKNIRKGRHRTMKDKLLPVIKNMPEEMRAKNPKISNHRIAEDIRSKLSRQYSADEIPTSRTIYDWLFGNK